MLNTVALNHAARCGNLSRDLVDGNLGEQEKTPTQRSIVLAAREFDVGIPSQISPLERFYTFTISLGLRKVINLFNIHYKQRYM